MKKLMSLLLVLIMVLSLAACGSESETSGDKTGDKETTSDSSASGKTDSQEASGSSDASDEPIKLVVWGGVPGESGPQALVDAWNAENPMVQVEYTRFVNDDTGNTKLDTAILSGEQIDVFFTYSIDLLKKRVEGGLVEDLAAFGVEDFVKNEVLGAGVGQVLIDGKYYGLPTAKEPIGFMINQTMLDEAGITIPDNWTLDDFIEIAGKLSGEKDGQKVYGTHGYYAGRPLDFALTAIGGDYFYSQDGKASNFDAPEFEANAKVKDLMDMGYAMPYEEVFSRKLEAYAHPAFLNGEVAMLPFSAWMLRYVKDSENFPHDFVTTFAPYPAIDETTPNDYQAYLNNHICMSSNSEYKEEAWAFIDYWLTEGSQYMLTAGKMPVWNKVDEDVVVAGVLGENSQVLFDEAAYRSVMLNGDLKYIVDTYTTAYPQVVQIYKEESEMFFLGATDKATYFENLKTRADEVIAAELNE